MLSFERKAADGGGSGASVAVAFFIAALSIAFAVAGASLGARMSEHLPHRKASHGPIAQSGMLMSMPEDSRSPLGDDASAWVGAVGLWDRRQGGRVFVPSCSIGRAHGVPIWMQDGLSLRLMFVLPQDGMSPYEGSPGRGRVALHLGPLSGEGAGRVRETSGGGIPELVKSRCGAALAKLGEDAVYRERTLASGTEVSVFGCKIGTELFPCGDGLDVVSVKSLDATRSALRGELPYLVALSALASLVALLAVGGRALSFVSRTRRTFR